MSRMTWFFNPVIHFIFKKYVSYIKLKALFSAFALSVAQRNDI